MASKVMTGISFCAFLLILATVPNARVFLVQAVCQTSDCLVCSPTQAQCKLCPNDPEIPDTVTDLWILASNMPCFVFGSTGWLQEAMFSRYTQLENLAIDGIGIKVFIGPVFRSNSNLTSLSIRDNTIRGISSSTFLGLTKLEYMDFENNQLSLLGASYLSPLTSLNTLNIGSNYITHLSGHEFDGLGNLEQLYLSNNPIGWIDGNTFKPLVKLTDIFMDGMAVFSIPAGLFSGLSSLKYVDLRGNFVSRISAQDFMGVAIETLDLSSNPIEVVEDGAFGGSDIRNLYLNDTQLTMLPASMNNWLQLMGTVLSLDQNRDWQCDCSALWLAQYLTASLASAGPICGANSTYPNSSLALLGLQLERDCVSTIVG